MNKPPHQLPPSENAADSEAINRVLQAELEAQQAVAEAGREAQAIVHAAQLRVQRINQRADERITRVHMRCAQWLSERSRLLAIAERAQSGAEAAIPGHDVTHLVDALAAQLTGTDTEKS
jgi:vacuolar-type H+-ATPase subunit H